MKRLTLKPQTLKMLQEDIKNTLEVTDISKNFLYRSEITENSPKNQQMGHETKTPAQPEKPTAEENSIQNRRKSLPVKPQTGLISRIHNYKK